MIALMAPLGLVTVVACLWCVLGVRREGWAMVLAVGMLGFVSMHHLSACSNRGNHEGCQSRSFSQRWIGVCLHTS
jgi:hypothetical protein